MIYRSAYKGVAVTTDAEIAKEEIHRIVDEEIERWKESDLKLDSVAMELKGDTIYVVSSERSPIRRLRRITGYISTLDSFNDAKRAEAKDRVAHTS